MQTEVSPTKVPLPSIPEADQEQPDSLQIKKEKCGCLFHSHFQLARKCFPGVVGVLGVGLLVSLKDI